MAARRSSVLPPPVRLVPQRRGTDQALMVAKLEEWLEQAKAGELSSLCLVATLSEDGQHQHAWVEWTYCELLGALHIAQHAISVEWCEPE